MPNWCVNELAISGPAEDVERLVALLNKPERRFAGEADDREHFDLNVCEQRPPEFDSFTTGGATIDGERVRAWRSVGDKSVKVPQEELDALVQKYGTYDWYEWCVEHWGTKWNACEVTWKRSASRCGQVAVRFDTAWSPPLRALEKLGLQWNQLRFELRYWEGGMGFQGTYVIEGGLVTRDVSSDYSGPLGG